MKCNANCKSPFDVRLQGCEERDNFDAQLKNTTAIHPLHEPLDSFLD
jgi:hypothetical protein